MYLSNISPLGIPFNSLKGNTKDEEKYALIEKGRPGSSCPKKYVELNKDFGDKALCTASRQYQHLKLQALDLEGLTAEKYQARFDEITEKSCICVGLGTSSLLKYDLDTRTEKEGVSVCPGPNIAYFSQVTSLQSMVNHIYGKENTMIRTDRPNMFVKELNIYLDYFKTEIFKSVDNLNRKQEKYLKQFGENLNAGIDYYNQVFENATDKFNDTKTTILNDLEKGKMVLKSLIADVEKLTEKK